MGQSEFPSVLLAWQRLRPRGVEVRAVGREAVVTHDEIAAAVDERTRVIAVSHVGYLTGARHDLGRLRSVADRVGARLVVDASHALGVVPVDGTLCDVVVACCYKWLLGRPRRRRLLREQPPLAGPGGALGRLALHAPRGRLAAPHGLPNARGRLALRGGEPSVPPVYVLESALRTLAGLDPRAVEAHVLALGGILRTGLVKLGLPVLTPEAPEERAGQHRVRERPLHRGRAALREAGVLVWAGDGRVRLSVHAYNDEADVARALGVLADLPPHAAAC